MKIVAYKIDPSGSHLPKRFPRGDIERYDAMIYPQGSLDSWDFITSSEYTGATPINFLGWLQRFSKTDLPYNSPDLPLMSRQMLEVLTGVGNFLHQAIPTRIVDFNLQFEIEEYLETQNFNTETCNTNYFVVKLLEHLDVIDMERTEFREDAEDRIRAGLFPIVTRLVMREPNGGFPPLFRVNSSPVPLFVSPAAKEALNRAGIKGTRFLAYGDDGTIERVEAA
jgi:hypothetical protein